MFYIRNRPPSKNLNHFRWPFIGVQLFSNYFWFRPLLLYLYYVHILASVLKAPGCDLLFDVYLSPMCLSYKLQLSTKFSDLFSCLPCLVGIVAQRLGTIYALKRIFPLSWNVKCSPRIWTPCILVYRNIIRGMNFPSIVSLCGWDTCIGYVRGVQTSGSENFKLHSDMDDPNVKRGITKKNFLNLNESTTGQLISFPDKVACILSNQSFPTVLSGETEMTA